MTSAEVRTGRANACKIAVTNSPQTVIGIRIMVIPGARSMRIVVR